MVAVHLTLCFLDTGTRAGAGMLGATHSGEGTHA